jgi:hypothetical protein
MKNSTTIVGRKRSRNARASIMPLVRSENPFQRMSVRT